MSNPSPPTMEELDCYGRPQFDRQRSYSAPEFRVIDVSATEAVIICSAAAKASDRRRGRRERRHVSLDVDAERSLSRHRPDSDGSDDDVSMNAALSEVLEEEEEEDMQTPTITLTSYAQNMASLMQQRIDAIQYGSPTSFLDSPATTPVFSPPQMLSIPDDQLCHSPPSEFEEEDVMEIDPAARQNRAQLLRPPLKSAFSAWSSVASTPATPNPPREEAEEAGDEEEPTNYFNFPEPPKSRVDSITSTVQQHPPSKQYANLGSHASVADTLSYYSQSSHRQQSSDQVLSNFSHDRPTSSVTAYSSPIYSCGQNFPAQSAMRGPMPISPYEGPAMPRVHHVC